MDMKAYIMESARQADSELRINCTRIQIEGLEAELRSSNGESSA
jgi:hypothetical protein